MRHIEPAEGVSYTASILAILSSLTLNEMAVLIGILSAIITAAFNGWASRHREAREAAKREEERREHEARMREHEARMCELHGQCNHGK